MLGKSEGGLGICNLGNVKIALMAKNTFFLLHVDNKECVEIV